MSSDSNWRKSSYSSTTGGQCLETASRDGAVLIRDTTDRAGVTLSVTGAAWTSFLATVA